MASKATCYEEDDIKVAPSQMRAWTRLLASRLRPLALPVTSRGEERKEEDRGSRSSRRHSSLLRNKQRVSDDPASRHRFYEGQQGAALCSSERGAAPQPGRMYRPQEQRSLQPARRSFDAH